MIRQILTTTLWLSLSMSVQCSKDQTEQESNSDEELDSEDPEDNGAMNQTEPNANASANSFAKETEAENAAIMAQATTPQNQAPAELPPPQAEPLPPPEPAPQNTQAPADPLSSIDMRGMSPPPRPAASGDLEPTRELLTWVGFHYLPKKSSIQLKIMATGRPEYEVFQERNQSLQPELVIRFLQTGLRKKIARDIDASEFRSPLAYVRMREDNDNGSTDVVITFRDPVQPSFFAKEGTIILNFPIPTRYFGSQPAEVKPIGKAYELASFGIRPTLEVGSEKPKTTLAFFQAQSQPTALAPQDSIPISNVMTPDTSSQVDMEGLPASFDKNSVAEPPPKNAVNAALSNDASNDQSNGESQDNDTNPSDDGNSNDNSLNQENETALPDPTLSGYALIGHKSLLAVAQDNNEDAAGFGTTNKDDQNFINDFAAKQQQNEAVKVDEKVPEMAPVDLPQADVQGKDNDNAEKPLNGKATSLEFNKTPMSLVLKTFSEESGNNFTFPTEVGDIPVTIYLRDVPWDGALKAILETYGLAMAMVGDKIVRVDFVEKMTSYMTKLEVAKISKQRLVPTKVLVMRLSHAKADAVAGQITAVLANDKLRDSRIQVAGDLRTNSVIIEATSDVLTKVKAIVERLDSLTPQIEISTRIVEVNKDSTNSFGINWKSNFNYDPTRALGFGGLNFPNSVGSSFSVDPALPTTPTGTTAMRLGSINKVLDLDLVLKMEESKETTKVLQSNRVLVLDRQPARIVSGQSQFFRPAAGGSVVNTGASASPQPSSSGLAQVDFYLELKVTPEVTATGLIDLAVFISSDTPSNGSGGSLEQLTSKNTRSLDTRMARRSGETAVIGGIYDTNSTERHYSVPFFSSIPIIGALFRSTQTSNHITELLIMITPKILKSPEGSPTNLNAQEAPTNIPNQNQAQAQSNSQSGSNNSNQNNSNKADDEVSVDENSDE